MRGSVGSASGKPANSARHRRRRVHRLPPLRVAARRRLGGLRARRPLDRLEQNVAHLRDRPRLPPRRRLGALDQAVVSELVHKCDVVYHLAAAVGVRLIVEQPVRTLVTNVQGTETVLEYCNRFGKRVLVASTSEVYGDHREEQPLARGRAPDLRPDDREALGVRRLEGDGRVPRARLPPGARPRLRDRAALQHRRPAPERPVRDGHPALRAERASRAPPLEIHGDGTQTRCFCHVAGHDARAEGADGRPLARRRDLQRRLDRADLDPRARGAGPAADGLAVRARLRARTTRSTARGSRTCSIAIPRSRRSAPRSAGSRRANLEDILRDVIEHARREPVLPEAEPAVAP